MDVATKQTRKVSENREGIGALSWSPDGRWLAYVMSGREHVPADQDLQRGDGSQRGAHDAIARTAMRRRGIPKGEFIYFLSDRNLQTLVGAPWGNRRPEPFFDKEIEIYQVALRAGVRSPFQPDDELARPAPAARPDTTRGRAAGADRPRRTAAATSARAGARQATTDTLAVNSEALFYTSTASGAGANTDLVALKLTNDKPEPVVVVDAIRSAELSANGKKMLVYKGTALHVIDAKPAKVATINDSRVDLTGWTFPIDTRDDFRQIFVDAWRLERDWFYDPNMHGVDYKATLNKYLPLVARITTRAELSDLIGWAVGELSALHTSVGGGDLRRGEDNVAVASLGARLFRDPAKGGYRIDYIYQTDPDYPAQRSPLADPDLGVKAGDVITAVNGTRTLDAEDIGELLRNQVGKQVLLTIGRRRKLARRGRDADRERGRASLCGLGVHAPPGDREEERQQDRVRAPARDGRRRHQPVLPRVHAGLQPAGARSSTCGRTAAATSTAGCSRC